MAPAEVDEGRQHFESLRDRDPVPQVHERNVDPAAPEVQQLITRPTAHVLKLGAARERPQRLEGTPSLPRKSFSTDSA